MAQLKLQKAKERSALDRQKASQLRQRKSTQPQSQRAKTVKAEPGDFETEKGSVITSQKYESLSYKYKASAKSRTPRRQIPNYLTNLKPMQ